MHEWVVKESESVDLGRTQKKAIIYRFKNNDYPRGIQ